MGFCSSRRAVGPRDACNVDDTDLENVLYIELLNHNTITNNFTQWAYAGVQPNPDYFCADVNDTEIHIPDVRLLLYKVARSHISTDPLVAVNSSGCSK